MNVDLRSDTVTKPTKEMLDYMLQAKVGDDVFMEDPTVNELEMYAAKLFDKEAGLFCPSGTMTNQIAIKVHTNPPGELICDVDSHIYKYEGGGIAFNSGLSARLLQGDRGRLTLDQIIPFLNPDDIHMPPTQLISLENTCNRGGGSIYAYEEMKKIGDWCKANHLKFHLDGARIFNAIVEADYSAKDIGNLFDTISICLSKGLGAPVGSVLVGDKTTIKKARRIRKIFGGGMRQAGIIAAAGLYALKNNIERLKQDHQRAKTLGEAFSNLNWVEKVYPVDTNIVVVQVKNNVNEHEVINQLAEKNIKTIYFGPKLIRLVTHIDVKDEHINYVLETVKQLNISC